MHLYTDETRLVSCNAAGVNVQNRRKRKAHNQMPHILENREQDLRRNLLPYLKKLFAYQKLHFMSDKTLGEIRVRTAFNPSEKTVVDQIKQSTAALINMCEELKHKDLRLASLAQTAYEEAAMWAVKAATA
jgi:predicted DNA-binding protein YlxM (UPF0122 family)